MAMNVLMVVSGGDAPGINMALMAITRQISRAGGQCFGVQGGLPGLLANRIRPLSATDIAPFAALPGSYLVSSREPVLSQSEAGTQMKQILDANQIDHVILFGGNGTLHHVLPRLVSWGISCVGLPVTIDNDVPGTDYTLGFDSACNYAFQAVDGAHATALALPGRIFMLETLGGNTGFLALAVASVALADVVLVPEYTYDEGWLAARLKERVETQGHAMIVLSEGAAGSRTLADQIPQWTGIRVRDIRLGHSQRGAATSYRDRCFAVDAARLACDALLSGVKAGVVVMRDGVVQLHEGTLEKLDQPQPDWELYCRINELEA